jgi:hypothetical protein
MKKMVHKSASDHLFEPSVGSIEHSAEMTLDKVRRGLTHGSGNLLEFIANNFPIIAFAV